MPNPGYLTHHVQFQQTVFNGSANDTTLYALVTLMPQAVSGRMPLDLRFVIDHSGSMSDEVAPNQSKLAMLKKAIHNVLNELVTGDRVSIYTFDDTARVLVPPTVIRSKANPQEMQKKVAQLKCGGGTRMGKALDMAVAESPLPDYLTRLILFTDGQICCNNAEGDIQQCLEKAFGSRGSIPWLIFGTGIDYDENFLSALAEANQGCHEHMQDVASVSARFAEEIRWMEATALTHLRLSIESRANFQLQQVFRVVPTIQPVSLTSNAYCGLDLGELDRVRGQKLLLQLSGILPPGDHKRTVAEIQVSYHLPLRKLLNVSESFTLEVPIQSQTVRPQADTDVLQTVQLTGANQLYTIGLQALQQGDQQTALRTLTTASELFTKMGQTQVGQQLRTLTTAVQQGTITPAAEDLKRTLSTQVRYTVQRTLTTPEGENQP